MSPERKQLLSLIDSASFTLSSNEPNDARTRQCLYLARSYIEIDEVFSKINLSSLNDFFARKTDNCLRGVKEYFLSHHEDLEREQIIVKEKQKQIEILVSTAINNAVSGINARYLSPEFITQLRVSLIEKCKEIYDSFSQTNLLELELDTFARQKIDEHLSKKIDEITHLIDEFRSYLTTKVKNYSEKKNSVAVFGRKSGVPKYYLLAEINPGDGAEFNLTGSNNFIGNEFKQRMEQANCVRELRKKLQERSISPAQRLNDFDKDFHNKHTQKVLKYNKNPEAMNFITRIFFLLGACLNKLLGRNKSTVFSRNVSDLLSESETSPQTYNQTTVTASA